MHAKGRRALALGTPLLALLGACGGGNLGSTGTGATAGGIPTGTGGTGNIDGGPMVIDGGPMVIDGGPIVIDGGSQVLAEGSASGAWDIAVDATDVYWTDQRANTVNKVPKAGGPTVTLASGQTGAYAVAVDSSFVYWTNSTTVGSVMKMPIGGGNPVPIATGQRWPRGIAVDATNLYWTNAEGAGENGAVMKAAHATGEVVTLAANQLGPSAIAVDATNVYWTVGPWERGGGELMKVPIAGGAPVSLVQIPSDDATTYSAIDPTMIAVDGTNVYWVRKTSPLAAMQSLNNVLETIPHAGGTATATMLLSLETRMLASIVVDGSTLTWGREGEIVRMPAAGGAATWQSVNAQPLRMTVDQAHIYFTTRRGEVMAMEKPAP